MNNVDSTETSFWKLWSPAFSGFLLNTTSIGLFGIYGVFVNVIAKEFNSSATALGVGMALVALVLGGTGPIIGPLLDRYPIKKIMLIGVGVMLLSFFFLTNGSSLKVLAVALCFVSLGVALFGQMPVNVMLVNNYIEYRGRALAIAAAGASFSGVILPPLAAILVSAFGWRHGLMILVIICGSVALWAILFGLKHYKKHDPESDVIPKRYIPSYSTSTEQKDTSENITLFHSKAFWLIGICFGLSYSVGSIYTFALIPHTQNLGYDIQAAALILSVGGAFGFIGKITYSIYADRLKDKLILTALCLLTIQLMVWFTVINTDDINMLYLSAAGVGLCSGTFLPLYPVFISTYFDEADMGKVSGNQGPVFIPFMLLAAPLAGVAFDTTGSYIPIFWGALGVTVVMMLLFTLLGNPQKPNNKT